MPGLSAFSSVGAAGTSLRASRHGAGGWIADYAAGGFYAANGQLTQLKGANLYVDVTGARLSDTWGFNIVRLVHLPAFMDGWYTPTTFLNKIESLLNAHPNLIVMPEFHLPGANRPDTGRSILNDTETWQSILPFHRACAERAVQAGHPGRVWHDVVNEPHNSAWPSGSQQDRDQAVEDWVFVMRTVAREVWAINPLAVIVTNGMQFGQDTNNFSCATVDETRSIQLAHGLEVRRGRPGELWPNIAHSTHAYEAWNCNPAHFRDYLDRFKAAGMPFLWGEFGQNNGGTVTETVAENLLVVTSQRPDVGWIVWAYFENDGNHLVDHASRSGDAIELDGGGEPTNLTWLGQQVWAAAQGAFEPPVPFEPAAWLAFSSGNQVSVPNNTLVDINQDEDFTFIAVVRSTQQAQSGQWPHILAKQVFSPTRSGFEVLLSSGSNSSWHGIVWIDGAARTVVGTAINDGEWHMVGFARQGTTLYALTDGAQTSSASGTAAAAANGASLVWAGPTGFGSNQFIGDIGWVGVWKRRVSNTEFAALWTNSVLPADPVAYWPVDEGSGTTVADAVGSLDGTISGAAWRPPAGGGATVAPQLGVEPELRPRRARSRHGPAPGYSARR